MSPPPDPPSDDDAAPAVAVAAPLPPTPASADEGALPFTVRRAVEKLGRNEPCHCGSGKKYKKCCLEKDRARLADPSPYAGLTMEEAKRDPLKHGDAGIFFEMRREELDAVDRTSLSPLLLVGLMEAYVDKGGLAEAARVLDELATRPGDEAREIDKHRDWLVYQALLRGDLEIARTEAARRGENPTFESQLNDLTIELGQSPLPRPLALVESFLRQLLDDTAGMVDLADAIALAGLPGLAIAVARAAAAIKGGGADREALADILVGERERLGLDGDDPALWLLERGGRAPARRRRGADELEAIEKRLREREAAIQQMRAERDRLAGELQERRLAEATAAHTTTPTESEDTRRLKRKVEELQAELRAKQQERLDLQRRLRSASESGEAARERSRGGGEPVVDLDGEGEPLPDEIEGSALRPVRFTEAFYESAAALDDGRLLLRAQEAAVRFAALDPATWKQAKKMQDLQAVFTLRVGIHHRLFVTRKDGEVAVRELVTREAFDRALKRYRR